jgi:hypothetical protein
LAVRWPRGSCDRRELQAGRAGLAGSLRGVSPLELRSICSPKIEPVVSAALSRRRRRTAAGNL